MAPNPKCIVCSEKPQVVVKIDTNRVTVKQFRDEVLVKALNMLEPDVITEGKGLVLISSEEGETDCNNDKKLHELDVVDGCILKVDDFVQQYELTIIIAHKDVEHDGDLYEILADPETLQAEKNAQAEKKPEEDTANEQDNDEPKAKRARHEPKEDSDDDLCIVEDGENDVNRPTTSAAGSNEQNSSSQSNNQSSASKPSTAATIDDDDDISIVEDENPKDVPGTSSENRNKRPRIEKDNVDDDLIYIDSD